jgi:hypothetical protein
MPSAGSRKRQESGRLELAEGRISKPRPRPRAVDSIANLLTFIGAFALLLSCCVLSGAMTRLTAAPPTGLTFEQETTFAAAAFILAIGATLTVLGFGFRSLKPWAYDGVEFLAKWSTLRPLLLGAVEQKDVRRAFGMSEESETDTRE